MILNKDEVMESLVIDSLIDWHFQRVDRIMLSADYYVPSDDDLLNEVGDYMGRMKMLEVNYRLGHFDCDAYALLCKGWATLQAWKDERVRPPWPFALAYAAKPTGHALNFCLVRTDGGLRWMFVEPQTGEIGYAEECDFGAFWHIQI